MRTASEPAAELSPTDDFGAWVAPHWAVMNRVAQRLADRQGADDIVQDALLGAWRHRERYDPSLGTPRAWLLAFVVDHARRSLRRRLRAVHLDEVPDAVAHPPHPDPDLRAAIVALSERRRLVVELHYYADVSVADIARALRCSEGTVKSTLSDARRALRAALGEEHRHD